MIILSVDPGGTTGWAKIDVDEEAVADGERVADCVRGFAYGEIPIVGGSGTSADIGTFSETAAEERVAALLHDLAVGPRPSLWGTTDGWPGSPSGGSGRRGGDQYCWSHMAEAVVFEDFVLREGGQSRSLLLPVRMTSAFRGMMWISSPSFLEDEIVLNRGSVPRWSIQSPSDGKSIVTNTRLKKWRDQDGQRLWVKGQQHARDALRHGLLWILKHQSAF